MADGGIHSTMALKYCGVLLSLALAVHAQPRRFSIQPAEGNKLELQVWKTGLYKGKSHIFTFPKYEGTIDYDPQRPESSSVSITISAADIKLMDTWLSPKDFKSVQEYAVKEMLNAAKFPEIRFTSMEVRAGEGGNFVVRGALTIRERAKPAELRMVIFQKPGEPASFEGKAEVKLTDFGLKPPTAALGLIGTADGMVFSFTLHLTPGS
jgi:polyisoprenoid-binding protein YceI